MAESRLPLLRGRITFIDGYQSPQGFGPTPRIPPVEPVAQRNKLLSQLDEFRRQIAARSDRDEAASRELVLITPIAGRKLAADQLDDSKSDARLVGVQPD